MLLGKEKVSSREKNVHQSFLFSIYVHNYIRRDYGEQKREESCKRNLGLLIKIHKLFLVFSIYVYRIGWEFMACITIKIMIAITMVPEYQMREKDAKSVCCTNSQAQTNYCLHI